MGRREMVCTQHPVGHSIDESAGADRLSCIHTQIRSKEDADLEFTRGFYVHFDQITRILNVITRERDQPRFSADMLAEATGCFYRYALANLDGFDGAGKFPGGYTRTTLEKLNATKVPQFVPVDLAPLAALEAELAEVRRKIRLTDDLIDQIVYRLYGLTEEEIAIVEGR